MIRGYFSVMLGYFANKLSIRTIHDFSMTMLAHSDRNRINLYFDHSKDEKTNLAPQQLAPEKIIRVEEEITKNRKHQAVSIHLN